MPIVWTLPDASVRVMQLADEFLAANRQEGETTGQAVMRLAEGERVKDPDLLSSTYMLVRSADMPLNKVQRQKWQVRGTQVIVDHTMPDRSHAGKMAQLEKWLDEPTLIKAMAIWCAGKFGLTPLQARQEIATTYRDAMP